MAPVGSPAPSVQLRTAPRPDDRAAIERIVAATGYFSPAEIAVAVELIDVRLAQGSASGYDFLFAETAGVVVGYTCFGLIACTASSFDLYWIAVDPAAQGQGVGRRLLAETERLIAAIGGTRVYIETSNRPQYQATRDFYRACGYRVEAVVRDFYAPGDDKVIGVREIAASETVA